MPSAASVLLMIRTEWPTASIMSGIVLKCLPRSGSFTLVIKSISQGLMSGEHGGWYSTSHCHPNRLVLLPFLEFSQTVRDPTRCDFAHVQAFFENVQDHRMGQSGLTGQFPNCPPSVSNNVATELTWASVALGRPGFGSSLAFCHPARKA